MKTIFLSFTPEPFYEPMKQGLKRYEYRTRFTSEECMAYLYLSSPIQKVVAKIKFGLRIELPYWEEKFKDDKEAMKRLRAFFKEGKNFAIPILEFQEIEPVPLTELQSKFENFKVPRSYFFLDNQPEVLNYLNSIPMKGEKLIHNLAEIDGNEVCIY